MSTEPNDDDLGPDDDLEPAAKSTEKANWRRKLEADAEAGRQAQAEAAAAKKELAFIRAGVDLDSPQGKLLAKAYDGDLTPDAVKAAAVEFGILAAEAPQVSQAELAAHDRIAAASGGGAQASDDATAEAEMAAAQTPEEVMAVLAKWGQPADYSEPGAWLAPQAQYTGQMRG